MLATNSGKSPKILNKIYVFQKAQNWPISLLKMRIGKIRPLFYFFLQGAFWVNKKSIKASACKTVSLDAFA